MLSAGIAILSLAACPGRSKAADPSCRPIRTEHQLEQVNHLVEEGELREVAWWGQKTIRPMLASRHRNIGRFRMVHPKHGDAHLAFDHACGVDLLVTVARRVATCTPNGALEKFVCGERWFMVSKKERWIKLTEPFLVPLVYGHDRRISISARIPSYYVPRLFALDGGVWTPTISFGGGK